MWAGDNKPTYIKKAKRKCAKYGIWGHYAKDCGKPSSSNNGDKKPAAGTFKGRCYYCDKIGHKKTDCRAFKNREIANAAIENTTSGSGEWAFNAVAKMPGTLNNVKTTDISGDIKKRNKNNNFHMEWN